MVRISFWNGSIFLLPIMVSCTSTKEIDNLFSNKSIVYSSEGEDSATSYNFNAFFIVYKNDTINLVKFPYSFVQKDIVDFNEKIIGQDTIKEPNIIHVPVPSQLPYKLKRDNRKLIITFNREGNTINRVHYSLKKSDSVLITNSEFLCPNIALNNGVSVFSGRDTSINFYNNKLQCWIFDEFYQRSLFKMPNHRITVYLEKKSLLPIMKVERQYSDPHFTKEIGQVIVHRINFVAPFEPSKVEIFKCNGNPSAENAQNED